MSKIARLFVHRLEQLARREARRNALRNGLLDVKAIEIGGHVVRRYMPVFDTSYLTGDRDKDLAWVRRHFGDYLQPTAGSFEGASVPAGLRSGSRRKSGSKTERLSDADHASSVYALSLIGQAGKAPLVSNITAAIVLARTIERARMTLAAVTRGAAMPAPVIAMHAPIIGFEPAIRRLIEVPGFVPGGDLKGLDGEYVYDDMTIAGDEGPGRTYVLLLGHLLRRVAGGNLQRRLLNALRRDYPVVAICEDAKGVPDEIAIAADINLTGGRLDYPFLVLMLEAVYGPTGRLPLDRWTNACDVHYLTIDDVVLAFRPGRSAAEVVAILASLTERNRIAARDGENDDDESDGSSIGSKTSKQKPGQASHDTSASGQDSSSGGWKRDKPSGAEVIQPEPWGEDGSPPSLSIETLPGYGKAKSWALDLKADLDDYRASILSWSDMSTKLLLSGPPGTGKTTFARALCNSLQVPLIVSSVSTWLQGAHLSDVLNRMTRTFAEARALAPAILFIDEIDGIGKRQPAEREYADYWNGVVNKALELLDGTVKGDGLIVVGATNRPEQIDEALKRSGRLETHIEIPRPDTATLAEIFRHHLGEDLKLLVAEVQTPNHEKPEIAEPTSDTGDGLIQ
ncbi:MAG: ATP-binding protein [Rhizobiaceae bacterium]|nr:ATP-binding protein [Rhizobiaceae bacterium]MCZ8352881.1 ATP-binding protein [Rhizobium sp.]